MTPSPPADVIYVNASASRPAADIAPKFASGYVFPGQQDFASLMRNCAKRFAIAAAGSPAVAGARAVMMTIITPTSEAGRTRAS